MSAGLRHGRQSICWKCAVSLSSSSATANAAARSRCHIASLQGGTSGATSFIHRQQRLLSTESNSASTSIEGGDIRGPFQIKRFHVRKGSKIDRSTPGWTPKMDTGLRQELKDWQIKHGADRDEELADLFGVTRSETPNSFVRPAMEEQSYDTEIDGTEMMGGMDSMPTADELDVLDPNHLVLRPGDLAELPQPQTGRDPIIGAFVRKLGHGNVPSQFITLSGKWVHTSQAMVQYSIPNFMDPELVESLIPHLPNTDDIAVKEQAVFFDISVPRHVSAPVISRLAKFEDEAQEIYRKHAARLENAHNLLAHDSELRFSPLGTITRTLLQRGKTEPISDQEVYATRLALHRAGFAFGWDWRHHRTTQIVHIRSKPHVRMVTKVQNWIREYREELASHEIGADPLHVVFKTKGGQLIRDFARHAREAIQSSREDRAPSVWGVVGPSQKKFPFGHNKSNGTAILNRWGRRWSEDEQEIIRFMEAWSCMGAFRRHSQIDTQPPLVLQATGMYREYQLRESLGFTFLQEIGVMVPWENRVRYDENLMIPSAQHSRELEQLMSKVTLLEKRGANAMKDTLSELRHDWGDLPVFCVDSAGAFEIDDGLSVEQLGDGEYWLHIHIANPTAFFNPTSDLASMARHMAETIYMPERPYTMLPSWAGARFSLRNGGHCLTFSAKMNDSGTVLDHKITPGIVRNVHFIDHKEVDKALELDLKSQPPERALVVGNPPIEVASDGPKRQTKVEDLTAEERAQLKSIFALGRARFGLRSAKSGISLAAIDQDIKVWDKAGKPGLEWSGPSRSRVKHVLGDPTIRIMARSFDTNLDMVGRMDSTMMVRESMLLACELASKWCHERNVPNIYRGSIRGAAGGNETAAQYYKRVLEPMMQRHGSLPIHSLNAYLGRSNPSTMSLEPLAHEQLGMEYFSKVTSPLRRFGDMVTHWQIQAALLEERRLKGSLVGAKVGVIYPFSPERLQTLMPTLQAREDRIKRAKISGINFWTTQLFFRAFYFGEMELPKTMTAYVAQTPTSPNINQVIIKEFTVRGLIMQPEELGKLQLGDEWEVNIHAVDLYTSRILLHPRRLLKRAEVLED